MNEKSCMSVLRQRFPEISRVHLAKSVTNGGINYRNGSAVACGSSAGMAEFAAYLETS